MAFRIKSLTAKNFMSIGNITQSIDFDRKDLTLVLGQNMDLGGDDAGARNGTGKCLGSTTIVKVRNTKTGEIYETTIGDLYDTSQQKDNLHSVIKNQ